MENKFENNCPFHKTCITYNRAVSVPPVPKDRPCCYNCQSEVYFLDSNHGDLRTECTLPGHTKVYSERDRELNCCPDFCRRSIKNVLPNPNFEEE